MSDSKHDITDADLEREFGDLITEVRAERPQIDPAFAAQLDERVAKPRAKREWLTTLRPSPALMGGLATAAAAIAVAVPVALDSARDSSTTEQPTSATEQPAAAPDQAQALSKDAAAAAAGATAGAGAAEAARPDSVIAEPIPPARGIVPPIDDGSLSLGTRDRKVERSASVTLSAPADKIEQVADDVIRVTDEAGGIVVTSNVTGGDDGNGRASFDLRVPTDKLRMFLRELSEIGDANVKSRTQGSVDVTRAVVSARDRLADARAERKSLLRLLAKAKTANETASIRTRLRIAASEIAFAQAQVRTLQERTGFSSVSVAIEAETGSSATEPDDGKWTAADAWDDAKRVLEVLAGIVLVGLAILLPALLLGGIVWMALGRAARRRREAALGGRE